MSTLAQFAAGYAVAATSLQVASIALAARKCRKRRHALAVAPDAPAVTLVQPLCGVEAFSETTLEAAFALDYPDYELIFCLAHADDPAAPLARRAMERHPERKARLLVGDERPSANPKLNNVVKGWKAARNAWIIIADSNVLMPPDYIQRLMASWRSGVGIVCAPPIGSLPESLAAELECAFLNTYEARWQYAADACGLGFAQGKSMLWRRDVLEAGGGVERLGDEIAEDAAATKLVRRAHLRPRLAAGLIEQRLAPQHGLALGEAEAGRLCGVLPARLIGVEEGAFEMGGEAVRAGADRRRADEAGAVAPARQQPGQIVGRHQHVGIGEDDPLVRRRLPALDAVVELGVAADGVVADQDARRPGGKSGDVLAQQGNDRVRFRCDAEQDLVIGVVEAKDRLQRLVRERLDAAVRLDDADRRRRAGERAPPGPAGATPQGQRRGQGVREQADAGGAGSHGGESHSASKRRETGLVWLNATSRRRFYEIRVIACAIGFAWPRLRSLPPLGRPRSRASSPPASAPARTAR